MTSGYIVGKEITVFYQGRVYQLPKQSEVLTLLKLGKIEEAVTRFDPLSFLKSANHRNARGLTIKGNTVLFDGEPLSGEIVSSILEFQKSTSLLRPLKNFLRKLSTNPNKTARKSLFDYLSQYKMPILPNGDFYGWKVVQPDFTARYDGTTKYIPGKFTVEDRKNVDESGASCSRGLHIGSFNYVNEFKNSFENYKIVLLRVNPRDVVSCPSDTLAGKIRACRVFVESEVSLDSFSEFRSQNGRKEKNRVLKKLERDKFGRFVRQ